MEYSLTEYGQISDFKTAEVSAGVDDSAALISLRTGEVDLVAQLGLAS